MLGNDIDKDMLYGYSEGEKLIVAVSTFSDVIENIEKSGIEYYIPNHFIAEQAVLYENIQLAK